MQCRSGEVWSYVAPGSSVGGCVCDFGLTRDSAGYCVGRGARCPDGKSWSNAVHDCVCGNGMVADMAGKCVAGTPMQCRSGEMWSDVAPGSSVGGCVCDFGLTRDSAGYCVGRVARCPDGKSWSNAVHDCVCDNGMVADMAGKCVAGTPMQCRSGEVWSDVAPGSSVGGCVDRKSTRLNSTH